MGHIALSELIKKQCADREEHGPEGEAEDQAAVADVVPIHHVAAHPHAQRGGAGTDAVDAHAERLINTYFDVQQAILRKRHDYVKKFGEVMSGIKVMRFFQLENKVQAEVNAALAVTIPLADPR